MIRKPALHTLAGFVAAIRELEQMAAAARKERDRNLARAREAAEQLGRHVEQAADLRRVLTDLDAEYCAQQLGQAFTDETAPSRIKRIVDFRDALAWLEAAPAVPFTDSNLLVGIEPQDRSPEAKMAELQRVAAAMGVEVEHGYDYAESTAWYARRQFGSATCHASITVPRQPAASPVETAEQPAEVVDPPAPAVASAGIVVEFEAEYTAIAEDGEGE